MTTEAATQTSGSDLLEEAARAQDGARQCEVDLLTVVVDFAVAHPPIDAADRSRETVPTGGVEGRTETIPLNSSGVPVVSACAVAELATRLAMSTDAARTMVAEALELSYRLPGIWDRVMAGDLQVWKARRIAASTLFLGADVVAFVDTHLRAVPGHLGAAMLERLIQTALDRLDPQELHRRTAAEAETRRLDVHLDQYTWGGTAPVSGVLELPDAIALDAALAHGAAELAALGSTDSLDARRAKAGGDLAREHLALFEQYVPDGRILLDEDGSIEPVPAPGPADSAAGAAGGQAAGAGSAPGSAGISERQRRRASRREVLLVAHINAAALTGAPAGRGGCSCAGGDAAGASSDVAVGRIENTRTPVDIDAIRRWLGDDNLKLTSNPSSTWASGSTPSSTRPRPGYAAKSLSATSRACSRSAGAPPLSTPAAPPAGTTSATRQGKAPAQGRRSRSTSTTSTPTTTRTPPPVGRLPPTTSPHCADTTTASRPCATGTTP